MTDTESMTEYASASLLIEPVHLAQESLPLYHDVDTSLESPQSLYTDDGDLTSTDELSLASVTSPETEISLSLISQATLHEDDMAFEKEKASEMAPEEQIYSTTSDEEDLIMTSSQSPMTTDADLSGISSSDLETLISSASESIVSFDLDESAEMIDDLVPTTTALSSSPAQALETSEDGDLDDLQGSEMAASSPSVMHGEFVSDASVVIESDDDDLNEEYVLNDPIESIILQPEEEISLSHYLVQ